jgi:hypothetical protein
MPTLYIITGPEGSGNRLMATAFIAAGCAGEASNVQPSLADAVREDMRMYLVGEKVLNAARSHTGPTVPTALRC